MGTPMQAESYGALKAVAFSAREKDKLEFILARLETHLGGPVSGFKDLQDVRDLLEKEAVLDKNYRLCRYGYEQYSKYTDIAIACIKSLQFWPELISSHGTLKDTGSLKRPIELVPINDNTQTFEDIIIECHDAIAIETNIEKAYKKWVSKECSDKKTKGRLHVEVEDDYKWHFKWFKRFLFLFPVSLLAAVTSFTLGEMGPLRAILVISTVISGVGLLASSCYAIGEFKIKWIKGKIIPGKKISESNKFEFLKDAYVGTIQKLNGKLDTVKDKINVQIKKHEEDREQITQYSDILSNTDSVLDKIEKAIADLENSRRKVSDKKGEVNKILEEYIGENGIIAQKQAEIDRVRIAQEISDRMKQNFSDTMEITKNVDVLTEAIIPGMRKLIEFKIPELIKSIENKCDVEKSYLEISA